MNRNAARNFATSPFPEALGPVRPMTWGVSVAAGMTQFSSEDAPSEAAVSP